MEHVRQSKTWWLVGQLEIVSLRIGYVLAIRNQPITSGTATCRGIYNPGSYVL